MRSGPEIVRAFKLVTIVSNDSAVHVIKKQFGVSLKNHISVQELSASPPKQGSSWIPSQFYGNRIYAHVAGEYDFPDAQSEKDQSWASKDLQHLNLKL